MGLEGVGFDDEEGVGIVCGNLGGLPGEEVDVDVSVPLRDDRGLAAVNHEQAVEDYDYGPVGLVGASADVNDGEVSVGDEFGVVG